MEFRAAIRTAILASVGLAAAAVFGAPSYAQGMGVGYVGGSLGQSDVKDACDGLSNCDDSDTAWKVFGGYQFTPSLAVEAGYTDLGEVSAREGGASLRAEATAWEVVGVGSIPVADRFSLYGKAGLYRAEIEVRVRIAGLGSDSLDESNNDLTFGFGARYAVSDAVGVRAEWQRYSDVGGGDIEEGDIDVMSVGVLFRF